MSRSVAAGIFKGSGGKLYPSKAITREEAFVVMARIYGLEGEESFTFKDFRDSQDISYWAREDILALVEGNYIDEAGSKSLRPRESITRAEYANLLYKMAPNLGEDSRKPDRATIYGNLILNRKEENISDLMVKGDLILAEGLGNSPINIENIDLSGSLVVRSAEDIRIKNSQIENIVVLDQARFVLDIDKDTSIKKVYTNKEIDIRGSGQIGSIVLREKDMKAQQYSLDRVREVASAQDLTRLLNENLVGYKNKVAFKVRPRNLDLVMKSMGTSYRAYFKDNRCQYANVEYSMVLANGKNTYNPKAEFVDMEFRIRYLHPETRQEIPVEKLRRYDQEARGISDKFARLNIDGKDLSDGEKVLKINDFITNKASYNMAGLNKYYLEDHMAYGVLVLNKGVCESYAKAFQLLAERAGLESHYVTGSARGIGSNKVEHHAWNIVKVDGKWYNVDTTWNDVQNIDARYQYFLKSDREIEKTHKKDRDYNYPTCRESRNFKDLLSR